MPRKKLLCIFTTLMGNRATTQRMMDVIGTLDNIEPTYVLLDVADYQRYSMPWWAKLTDPWQSEYLARCKAAPVLDSHYDAMLVNGWELMVAFQDVAQRIPAAAMMDAVPATSDCQLRRRGHGGVKRLLSFQLHHFRFARAAREFQLFLPMGSDCKDSLERDYGIPGEQCFVTLAPQDTDRWKPASAKAAVRSPLRLLFVTNDFDRKGGDFLLDLFSRHLSDGFTLTIASNDPKLEAKSLPAGVEWLRGLDRERMMEIYRSSDVFVFPTQQDYMPQVLAEALATGVPCIANDVGGIRDLVLDGKTGFLMSPDATPAEWAQRVFSLADHPEELQRISREARIFAEEKLTIGRFQELIQNVMNRLVGSPS